MRCRAPEIVLALDALPRDDARVRRYDERCGHCAPGRLCANHQACLDHADARIAADLGIGWARFVYGQIDVRRPWPEDTDRCAAISRRLVAWLAPVDPRQTELAQICRWRAGITWDALLAGCRDRPYRQPTGQGVVYELPGHAHVVIRFRPRHARRGDNPPIAITDAVLAQPHLRAQRYREAQGVHGTQDAPWSRPHRGG